MVGGTVPPGACGPLSALRETGAEGVAVDGAGAGVVFAAGAQAVHSRTTAIRTKGFFTSSPLGGAGTGTRRGHCF
ncbi:hypothetical protein D3C78_1937510 [compost metagenome]